MGLAIFSFPDRSAEALGYFHTVRCADEVQGGRQE
jgi:hypothetical protein